MKKLFLLLLAPCAVFGQLTGTIVSHTDKQPVAFASVFINNSTVGATTDENGHFRLNHLSHGKHELVVSLLGYEKYFEVITVPAQKPLRIELVEKANQLEQVTVTAYDKDGWKTWGKLFLESFIGTSANAERTVLRNHEDLRFRYDKAQKTLDVFAVAPLHIQNRALGYQLEYHLELFHIDFGTQSQVYAGYPFFKEVRSVSKRQHRLREEAYFSSLTRFMRSLYQHTVEKDGYTVRRLVEQRNLEKERVKALMDKYTVHEVNPQGVRIRVVAPSLPPDLYPPDSLTYFNGILAQPDSHFALSKDTLTTASYVSTDTTGARKLFFKDYLYVVNVNHKESPLYLSFKRYNREPAPQTSLLKLVEESPLEIQSNGNYFPPLNLYTGDYWAWSNKIADLLPLDYNPRSSTP